MSKLQRQIKTIDKAGNKIDVSDVGDVISFCLK